MHHWRCRQCRLDHRYTDDGSDVYVAKIKLVNSIIDSSSPIYSFVQSNFVHSIAENDLSCTLAALNVLGTLVGAIQMNIDSKDIWSIKRVLKVLQGRSDYAMRRGSSGVRRVSVNLGLVSFLGTFMSSRWWKL